MSKTSAWAVRETAFRKGDKEMGMIGDAGNGIVVLVRVAIFLVCLTVCGLGMLYLPLAVLGIDNVDALWKGVLCVSGVIGTFWSLAYIGRR